MIGDVSVDSNSGTHGLYAKNCYLKVIKSGYGAYAIGNWTDTFDNCTVDVDVGIILAGGASGVWKNGTVINAKRWAMMSHGGSGGTLSIDGCTITTGQTAFLTKSSSPSLTITNSVITAGPNLSGETLVYQSMVNDDAGSPGSAGNVTIDVTNSTLNGDIACGLGTLTVTLNSSTILNGAITSTVITALAPDNGLTYVQSTLAAVAPYATSAIPFMAAGYDFILSQLAGTEIANGYPVFDYPLYMYMGQCSNIYGAAQNVTLSVNNGATWNVRATSYLTSLTVGSTATIAPPAGHTLTMTVGGVSTPIAAGTYTGTIVITVN